MTVLTIRQVLDLPLFASSQLVAGSQGLDNVIRWVHVVDLKNAHYEWQRRGILLLTSGLGFGANLSHQKALINRLVQLEFAGLVLSTGHYLEQAPEGIRCEADRLGLPIIEAPPDLLFIQITETILSHLVSQNYTMLHQVAQVNQQLTDLVLQGASWQELASTLNRHLQRSVAIELPTLQVAAVAEQDLEDTAWMQAVKLSRSLPHIADYLAQADIDRTQPASPPYHLPPNSELGLFSACMVVPIVIDRDVYGYIWLLAGAAAFTPLDERILAHGATVAGLMLAQEQAVRKDRMAQQGDFLTLLLANHASPSQLQEQAQRFNFRLGAVHQVVLLRFANPSVGSLPLLQTIVQQLIEGDRTSLLAQREDTLIVVLEADQPHHGPQFAAQIIADLNPRDPPLVIGLGNRSPASDIAAGGLRQSYEQAQEAAHIGILLQQTGAIAFADLGLLHWLYHLAPEHRDGNPYLHHVRTLATHDTRRRTSLLDTLETYLDRGQSVAETADALFIHRNTLLKRLERIEALCELNLRDATQYLNLNVAIKSYRLHG